MKKSIYFFLALAAMVLSASCNKETVVSQEFDPNAISYKALAYNSTKAGAVDNSNLSNAGTVYISAIKLNDDKYYFTNNQILGADLDASTANHGQTSYYWPAYKLGFFAANAPLTVTQEVNNEETVDLTPSIDNFEVPRTAFNAPNELMVAMEAQHRDDASTVQLNLHHALAKLTIAAVESLDSYTVSVAGVQLGGFYSKGTFTFPEYNTNNGSSDTAWEGLVSASYGDQQVNNLNNRWSGQNTILQYGYLNLNNEVLSGSALTGTAANIMGNNYFYIIPQAVTKTTNASGNVPEKTDHYIDILVNVRNAAGVQIYPSSSDANKFAVARVYIPAGQAFEAGKSYTITLNFNSGIGVSESGQSLYNAASADQSNTLTNFVKAVSPEFPNDEYILGQAIGYTVTTNGWIDVNSPSVSVYPQP